MAELIGVSQTYVSRLESGLVQPPEPVAAAIMKLAEDPRTRSLFDDLRATVDHSPFPCLLLQTGVDGPDVAAVSEVMARDFLAGSRRLTDTPALRRLSGDLDALTRDGLNTGHILGATSVWVDHAHPDRFWQVRYTPIRDETGAGFVHITLARLDDSPAARAAAKAATPRIDHVTDG